MSTQQHQEGHICPECGNHINEAGEMIDHHTDCPARTNIWRVHYEGELLCFLCDIWLLEDDEYRMLPVTVSINDDALLESFIGLSQQPVRCSPVCMACSTLSVIRGGKWDDDPSAGR